MTRYSMLLAGAAALAFSSAGAVAQTNCADEIADLSMELGVSGDAMTTGSTAAEDGIEKDGSLAPLEGDDAADAGDDSDQVADMAARGSPGVGAPSADEAHGGTGDDMAAADTEAETGDMAAADTGAETGDASGGEAIAKDGTTAPLQEEAGEGLDQAASPADTEAEQAGDDVAAADADTQAETGLDTAESAVGEENEQAIAALDRARAAQAAGNEQECLDAVEEARELHQQ